MTMTGLAHAMVHEAPTPSKRFGVKAAIAVLLSLTVLLADPLITPAQAAKANPQHRLLRLINGTRRRHGTHAVWQRHRISRLARRHSRRMARTRTLFHSSGLSRIGSAWGENVGYTFRSVRSVHRAFMRSASHRSNILAGRFHRIGLGIYKSGRRLWVTEIFAG
jgi:uncharacterized protein YkwD